MSPLPEQFSEARKLQIEAQFNILTNFTGKAFESAEKIIALNIDTSRASLEKSSALVRQMIAIKDPRDLLALTKQTQFQFDSMLAYSRELFGIVAAAAPAVAAAPAPALTAPAAAPAPAATPEPAVNQWTSAPETETPAPALLVVQEPAAQPVVEAEPIAEPNAVAKALGVPEALQPSAASFPVPSSSTPIAVGQVTPVEAAPPPAPVAGTPSVVTKKAEAPGNKASRKK